MRRRILVGGGEGGFGDGLESHGEDVNGLQEVAGEARDGEVARLLLFSRSIALEIQEVGLKVP